MTNNESRRAGFEVFAKTHYHLKFIKPLRELDTGEYVDEHMELAWQAYNAALDGVCVVLPHDWSVDDMSPHDVLALCREYLSSAGILHK